MLIVPGFVTTKLEVWQGVNCSTDEMRCAGVSAAQPLPSQRTAPTGVGLGYPTPPKPTGRPSQDTDRIFVVWLAPRHDNSYIRKAALHGTCMCTPTVCVKMAST